MVSFMVILFSTEYLLLIYMYIDILKLKTYKLFENSDADLSGFFFKEANLYFYNFIHVDRTYIFFFPRWFVKFFRVLSTVKDGIFDVMYIMKL